MDHRYASSDEDGSGGKKLHKRDGRLGEEDWQGEFEEQLLDLYDSLKAMNRVGGWPIFDKLTYPEFAHFAWKNSSKFPSLR